MKSLNSPVGSERYHVAVMLENVRKLASFENRVVIVDATMGDGGHSEMLLGQLPPNTKSQLISFEIDNEAIQYVTNNGVYIKDRRWSIRHRSYVAVKDILKELDLSGIDFILFDWGVSSRQLDQKSRGFSFHGLNLDMRMNSEMSVTAADLLNAWYPKELEQMFVKYGSIPQIRAKALSKQIVKERRKSPFNIQTDVPRLNRIVTRVFGGRRGQNHPSTVTFMCLRIAVNNEYINMQDGLNNAWQVLNSAGKMVIISYHSLERQLVESFIEKNQSTIKETSLPQFSDIMEIEKNVRSRSAQLISITKK